MNQTQSSERINWLGMALAAQRDNLAKILLRLKGIGVRAGASLGLHRKFIHLLEQIATDRQKELDIINEIEAVEKRHREMKQSNRLRRAGDRPTAKPEIIRIQEEKPAKRLGFLTLLGLVYLFSAKPINHKKQELTVD